jgi:hypothetical protein
LPHSSCMIVQLEGLPKGKTRVRRVREN